MFGVEEGVRRVSCAGLLARQNGRGPLVRVRTVLRFDAKRFTLCGAGKARSKRWMDCGALASVRVVPRLLRPSSGKM